MSDTAPLTNETVGLLIAPRGTEDSEFTEPRRALEAAGAEVVVLGLESGEAHTVDNDLQPAATYDIDATVADRSNESFDALVIPGGTVGADTLRQDDDVLTLVERHVEAGRPIGVICHGPWVLVEADVTEGRRLTSYPSLATDIRNAGGDWVDEEVVIDRGLVTSRTPDDLPAFCESVIEATVRLPAD